MAWLFLFFRLLIHYYYSWDTDINSKTKWAPTSNFIDGTDASVYTTGDDTKSLVQYKDTNISHDHTYYGMGCPNNWGTSGELGSDIPCVATGRIVKDGNNEDQKNGTYYHYQAASVGTGSTITTNNANVPDTFCPLGWQLPYSGKDGVYYNQSKSWKYLFDSYSITYDDGGTTESAKIKSYPFSYVHSGNYNWNTGRLYNQGNHGNYWPSTVVSSTNAYSLGTWSLGILPANSQNRTNGFPLRCVTRN